jgi:hypothetical protein
MDRFEAHSKAFNRPGTTYLGRPSIIKFLTDHLYAGKIDYVEYGPSIFFALKTGSKLIDMETWIEQIRVFYSRFKGWQFLEVTEESEETNCLGQLRWKFTVERPERSPLEFVIAYWPFSTHFFLEMKDPFEPQW